MGKKLYRRDFVSRVHNKLKESGHGLTWVDVYWFNKAYVEALLEAVENGDEVYVRDVFTLKTKFSPAHKKMHMGNWINIPDRYLVQFIPRARMQDACKKLLDKENGDEKES